MAAAQQQPASTFALAIAQWLGRLAFDDLPDQVVEVAKECFRDTISCAILGSSLENTKGFAAAVGRVGPGGEATVVRARWRASAPDAAFINAIYAHGCELDDGFVGAGGHPGSVVVPVALALAEQERLSGRDVITAIVAGYEIMHRATAAIDPHELKRGFQPTGIGGPFGSTAAAATLRRLPAERIAQALGIAGSYCCGLCEYDQSGGESKRLYAGNAARAGIQSADMAAAGVTGPLTIFEGVRGVWAGFSDQVDEARSTAGLGSTFRILCHKIKTYPTVSGIHGSIDALIALSDPVLSEADVQSVTVKVPPVVIRHGAAVQVPWDMVSAQFSLAFSLAMRIHFGRNDLDLYRDPAVWSSPAIVALCRKVSVVAMAESELSGDPDMTAIVTVGLTDGTTRTRVQHAPTGSPKNPLSAGQLRSRFFSLAGSVLPENVQNELDDAISHLESLETINELARMLAVS